MSIDALAWAFSQNVTPSAAKFVLVAIADCADDHGICWPSVAHIMRKTGISKRSVINHTSSLIDLGIIQKAGRARANRSHCSNAYVLCMGQGEISDHPMSGLFVESGLTPSADFAPPLVQPLHPPSANLAPYGANLAPLEASENSNKNLREREPLSRDVFLLIIEEGFKGARFADEFSHMSHEQLIRQVHACLDRWANNMNGNDPVEILKSWLRKGIFLGTVPKKKEAQQDGKKIQIDHELADWQSAALANKIFTEPEMISWISKLEYDGQDTITAPTRFIADHLRKNFLQPLRRATSPNVHITV